MYSLDIFARLVPILIKTPGHILEHHFSRKLNCDSRFRNLIDKVIEISNFCTVEHVWYDIQFSAFLGTFDLQKYTNESDASMSSERACYMTYQRIHDGKNLPVEFIQKNGKYQL